MNTNSEIVAPLRGCSYKFFLHSHPSWIKHFFMLNRYTYSLLLFVNYLFVSSLNKSFNNSFSEFYSFPFPYLFVVQNHPRRYTITRDGFFGQIITNLFF
jgi:hypothetical protein